MAIFTNQATLTYNNTVTNSNIATGEILEVLSATKTAVTETYGPDSDITYVISIVNSGATAISGVTVTDDLGAYTVNDLTVYPLSYTQGSARLFINGILQTPPTVTGENNLVISGITVPAGGNSILIYEASVTEFAPLDLSSLITNTASITGNGVTAPVEVSETVTPAESVDLSITKTITPAVVTENSRITYTFIIQNFGNTPAVATGGGVVSDTFNPILSDLAVTLNGNTLAEGTGYEYNEGTGLFTTVPGVITVPAATFTQNAETGVWETTPGVTVLTVVGTI